MKKAVVYIRSLKKWGSKKYFKEQRKRIKEYAKNNKIEIVESFEEIGTGLELYRDTIECMLSFIKQQGNIDYVIVDSEDRISRSYFFVEEITNWLNECGAELLEVNPVAFYNGNYVISVLDNEEIIQNMPSD